MNRIFPRVILYSESSRQRPGEEPAGIWWRFVLQSMDSDQQLVATDTEPEAEGERLELLAVVRGLEAIDKPSRVTLVTKSRYVTRGFRYGMDDWRVQGWRWEHFGRLVPIKNQDLWRRIDRALKFHQVECHHWRFDLWQESGLDSGLGLASGLAERSNRLSVPRTLRKGFSRRAFRIGNGLATSQFWRWVGGWVEATFIRNRHRDSALRLACLK